MEYDPQEELRLLDLLAKSDDANGVFFARWDEIKAQNYSQDFLNDIEGSPDLNDASEYHLQQMQCDGLVEYLTGWSMKEGSQFRITKQGHLHLKSIVAKSAPTFRISRWFKPVWKWLLALVAVVWMLLSEVLSPNWYCPILPSLVFDGTTLCDELATEE